jgi:diguanylate cyclase (GGDEF)-like protein
MFMTSAPRRLPASSKLAWVRVEGSKNRLIWVRPRSTDFFLSAGAFAFMAIDLDRFKPINDTYGHGAGDRVLQEVADRILGELPPGAAGSRMGGDEFAISLPLGEDAQSLERLARRICTRIAEPLDIGGRRFSVSASVGIACYPQDGKTIADIMTHADMAMYDAKRSGRNTFTYFDHRLGEAQKLRIALETELAGAIEANQIVPYLQPIFDLKTGNMTGFEILARWLHPERGEIQPDDFISLAEDIGVIAALSDSVLRQACEAVAAWPQSLKYAFNLSPLQFHDPGLVERVTAILDETGLRRNALEVEITETVFIDDSKRAKKVIDGLRSAGIAVALDDFGKGYSSLGYLSQYAVDKLKIDRGFIARRKSDARIGKIIDTLIQLGTSLGIETTAEGIETAEDADWLADHGCSLGQGFHYARPMPLLSALSFFEEYSRRPALDTARSGDTGSLRA